MRTRGLVLVMLAAAACGNDTATQPQGGGLGVEVAELSAVVENPYVAFASIARAVYAGEETDPDSGETVKLRVESTVRDATTRVGGADVTVVEVLDYEDGELVEKTEDYYAQHSSGAVYYLGERVDEYDGGELSGHGGQWLAGEDGNLAGVFMPASPAVGDVFEQERAPGIAEDRSTVVAVGVSVTVPAGTFQDCIETEDLDPIDDVTEHKFYCPGVGLVRETFTGAGSLDLVEFEKV